MQGLDVKADQLVRRRGALPEADEASRLANEHAEVESSIVMTDTEIADLGREQRKADADVEQVRARRSRDQERLDRGQVNSPKELESLQDEIATLTNRQSELEEVELEIMERLEDAQQRLSDLREQKEALSGKVVEAERARDSVYTEIDAELEQLRSRRAEIVSELPDALSTLYEKLRGQHGGIGAAALRKRRCEGCNIELDAAELTRIAAEPAEVVQRCDNCRRILVRVPDSGV